MSADAALKAGTWVLAISDGVWFSVIVVPFSASADAFVMQQL